MNTYQVTLALTKAEFIDFLDSSFGTMTVDVHVIKGPTITTNEESKPAKTRKPLRVRKSKVNDTLMKALENGPQTPTQLKTALETAGLSPGSLSTGLSLLQKAGAVRRIADGIYELRQAAE
jgi:predicted Rossmann fold nucleotide-binding protein DprA/Smf involved in DNA uptake